jgi:hypothetical protein
MEKTLVEACTTKLLKASLGKLFKVECASLITMLAKNDIVGNWTTLHYMCGNYRPMNKRVHFEKYFVPPLERDI